MTVADERRARRCSRSCSPRGSRTDAAAEGSAAGSVLAGGLLATAFAGVLGAVAHGTDPRSRRGAARRASGARALYTTGFIGAATVASVAFFAARGSTRTAILVFAGTQARRLHWISVTRRPEFRVAAADYGGALAILLAGAVYAMVRWRVPGNGVADRGRARVAGRRDRAGATARARTGTSTTTISFT